MPILRAVSILSINNRASRTNENISLNLDRKTRSSAFPITPFPLMFWAVLVFILFIGKMSKRPIISFEQRNAFSGSFIILNDDVIHSRACCDIERKRIFLSTTPSCDRSVNAFVLQTENFLQRDIAHRRTLSASITRLQNKSSSSFFNSCSFVFLIARKTIVITMLFAMISLPFPASFLFYQSNSLAMDWTFYFSSHCAICAST